MQLTSNSRNRCEARVFPGSGMRCAIAAGRLPLTTWLSDVVTVVVDVVVEVDLLNMQAAVRKAGETNGRWLLGLKVDLVGCANLG